MSDKEKKSTGGTSRSNGENKKKTASGAGGKGKAAGSASGNRARPAGSSAGSASRGKTQQSAAGKSGASAKNASGRKPAQSRERSAGAAFRNNQRESRIDRELRNSPEAKRIADERRRRKYNKNRRLYNVMFYAAIAVAVISVVVILSVTVLFNISAVTVERGKNVPYSDDEILAACGIEPGDNLFAIDTEQAALRVTTNLPYIEVCNITRRLPSTLMLDVHAAVVLGSVTTNDGAYIVLSANGRALEYADSHDPTQPLTRLNGMEMTFGGIGSPVDIADEDELRVAAELVVGFSLYDLRLDEITFDKAGAVTAVYDGRVNIRFGMPTDLSQKVQIAASMISEGKIAKNEAGILDLSISERVIFTPDYIANNN